MNFYAIIYYFALKKANILPSFFDMDIIIDFLKVHPSIFIFVFIIVAIFMSIFIEGICQIGIEACFYLYGKDEGFKDKNLRRKIHNMIKGFFNFFFARPTILRATMQYFGKKDNDLMLLFMDDTKEAHKTWKYFNGSLSYNALNICASVIEKETKSANIYHYKDHSFIMQILRMSFLCIAFMTLLFGLAFWIFQPDLFNNAEYCKSFFNIHIPIFIIAFFFFLIATPISYSFGKRYVRQVGFTYEALRLNLPINNKERSKEIL